MTRDDIDRVLKQWEEEANKPTPMTHCPSCELEFPKMFNDYFTGQCQECFYARKKWYHTSEMVSYFPLRDPFFLVENVE